MSRPARLSPAEISDMRKLFGELNMEGCKQLLDNIILSAGDNPGIGRCLQMHLDHLKTSANSQLYFAQGGLFPNAL